MDTDFSAFRSRTEAGWRTAPDFRVLVAFLAGAQASLPTARIACRLTGEETCVADGVSALIELFAPLNRRTAPAVGSLGGRFHNRVPFPDAPVTSWKAP